MWYRNGIVSRITLDPSRRRLPCFLRTHHPLACSSSVPQYSNTNYTVLQHCKIFQNILNNFGRIFQIIHYLLVLSAFSYFLLCITPPPMHHALHEIIFSWISYLDCFCLSYTVFSDSKWFLQVWFFPFMEESWSFPASPLAASIIFVFWTSNMYFVFCIL